MTVIWLGAALVLVAFLFFALDLIATNHGLPTVGGIVALVVGVLVLFDPSYPIFLASLGIFLALAGLLAWVFVASTGEALDARDMPSATGAEGMIGEIGTVREEVDADSPGWVFVRGELWRAVPAVPPEEAYDSEGRERRIGVGSRVQVVGFGDGRVTVLPVREAVDEHSLESQGKRSNTWRRV